MVVRWTMRVAPLSAVAAAAALVGCQSDQAESGPAATTTRAAIVTAPADLQLLCASEAATRFGVPGNTVLPVASAQVAPGRYSVELTTGESAAACEVDADGNILSLVRA